jgi:hypothetical protein
VNFCELSDNASLVWGFFFSLTLGVEPWAEVCQVPVSDTRRSLELEVTISVVGS